MVFVSNLDMVLSSFVSIRAIDFASFLKTMKTIISLAFHYRSFYKEGNFLSRGILRTLLSVSLCHHHDLHTSPLSLHHQTSDAENYSVTATVGQNYQQWK